MVRAALKSDAPLKGKVPGVREHFRFEESSWGASRKAFGERAACPFQVLINCEISQQLSLFKGRVWSKIMFCVWLAFAVKIGVAMTAELNLALFTRYEPRKLDGDDVTTVSLTRARAV